MLTTRRQRGILFGWILVWLNAAAAAADERQAAADGRRPQPLHQEILVYYANETQPDAVGSENYQWLFRALSASGVASADTIVQRIRDDAEQFPTEVNLHVDAIARSARFHGFEAMVFTNELARKGLYLSVDGMGGAQKLIPFPAGHAGGDDPVFAFSPLSRPETFRAALTTAAALAKSRGRNLILITNSHSDRDTALMPRVFAAYTELGLEQLSARIRAVLGGGNPAPGQAAAPLGITKHIYWRLLHESGAGERLTLVVRQGCHTGVSSLSEYLLVPGALKEIASSGVRRMKLDEVDYESLLGRLSPKLTLSEQIKLGLREQGMDVQSRVTVLAEIASARLHRVNPAIYFVPLILWLTFYGRKLCSEPGQGVRKAPSSPTSFKLDHGV